MMTTATRFNEKIKNVIPKDKITTLQVNLGRKCNQSCHHCHVDASPKRVEEISEDVKDNLIEVINTFDQIQTVDITGGAPECHYGFRDIVVSARKKNKEVIVRSNLTIFYEEGYQDLPDFFAQQGVNVTASLPCYLEQNVNALRGSGVYQKSIQAIKELNDRGYGKELTLNLVYNPAIPKQSMFSLPPDQQKLESDYKKYLKEQHNIDFSSLLAFTNLPLGRFSQHLKKNELEEDYITFLANNFNPSTLDFIMCRSLISVDYKGFVYDCDFNQIANLPCINEKGEPIHLNTLLEEESLDIIREVRVRDYCFGCTAGSGSSCSGVLM